MRFKKKLAAVGNGSKQTISTMNGFTVCKRGHWKQTISTSSVLERLQMVLEPDIMHCVNKDIGPRRVDCERQTSCIVSTRILDPKG